MRRGDGLASRLGIAPAERVEWSFPDRRRAIQLALAAIWLLDGVLQLQPFMFTEGFGSNMLAPLAHGNPAVVASSISWASREIARSAGLSNTVFALVQLALGVGIAWRRTMKAALVASIAWAAAVWWFGEGLGGVLAGTANPITGAPGAVILYALLAVLLWPAAEAGGSTFSAVVDRPLGPYTSRVLWILLWGSLSWMSLWTSNRRSGRLASQIAAGSRMAPHWLASMNEAIARGLADQGLAPALALSILCAVIALGVLAPPVVARPVLAVAGILAIGIWLVGEDFGGMVSGQGTDPNSGPLLLLLVAAYWPVTRRRRRRDRAGAPGGEIPA